MDLKQHRTLSRGYVFYERLKDDGYESLYSTVKQNLVGISASAKSMGEQSERLFTMSDAELQKELSLIRNIFGINLQLNLREPGAITELINTLNSCLGLKEVFLRNAELIKNTNGQKSTISFFGTYFFKVWKEKETEINEKLNDLYLTSGENFPQAASDLISQYLDKLVPQAVYYMLNARTETEANAKYQRAYQELLGSVGRIQESGSLANQLYSIYELDSFKNSIIEMMQNSNGASVKINRDSMNKNIHQRGGYSLEAVENNILKIVADGLNKGNIKATVIQSGHTGAKADNIMTFNFNMENVLKELETKERVSREKNINLFNKINRKLQYVNDGYIVYSSAKNYTLNAGFKSRGGFMGESIGLKSFSQIMERIHKNSNMLVGAILQTLEGAVGDKELENNIKQTIAQDIAYFLFDDFNAIGRGSQAIHIFNLNGIYIPLSYLLYALGQAIEDAEKDPRRIVKVDIRKPVIEFPTREEQADWMAKNQGENPWHHQRDEAYKKVAIEVHFLANFQSLIQQYI